VVDRVADVRQDDFLLIHFSHLEVLKQTIYQNTQIHPVAVEINQQDLRIINKLTGIHFCFTITIRVSSDVFTNKTEVVP